MAPFPPDLEVVFLPGDPPRAGALAWWRPPGTAATAGEALDDEVELALPTRSGARRRTVAARRVPVGEALADLVALPAGAEVSGSLTAWSTAAKLAANLVARGRLLPAITPSGFDAWRVGPLDRADAARLGALAAALPPAAHAVPMAGSRPLRVHSPQWLVRHFCDSVADALVRSPAAAYATAHPAFAGAVPVRVDELREWLSVAEHGLDGGARPGLRLELPSGTDADVRAVLQLRSHADPSLVVDAADLWDAPAPVLALLGRSAEADLLLGLRRGARAWAPLGRALEDARPAGLELDDAEAGQLLGPAADDLAGAGFEVLWPTEVLGDGLTLRAVVAPVPTPASVVDATFGLDDLLEFRWELAMGGDPLTEEELAALAEAKRPLVRLRGRWVTVDPSVLERLRRRRRPRRLRAGEALAAALAGTLDVDGETVDVRVEGPLAALAERLRGLEAGRERDELDEPAGLEATLRPYQRRGLAWLAEMCDLGLGGCLADDMGLGKTVQVIALHLHRAGDQVARAAGPTLVVCPASLLGNWERELGRFAPGVAVRRYHGGGRHLDHVGPSEVVLVTYGVIRRDREALAEVGWGLVVADEAQHVKNPLARTARELRAVPAASRVALTGTPVENRLTELWAILDWTTPGLLGPLDAFRREVSVPIERYRDPESTARLARLVRPFLFRRRKSDPGIAPELPAKTETDVVVPLTPEQATLYEAVVREALAEIAETDGMARRGLVLKLLTALKQVCNHPAHYLAQKGPVAGRSGKLAAFDELCDVIVAEGESVLVFSQYVAMGRLLETHLAARGIGSAFLHGGLPVRRRDELVAGFQAGDVPVFLLSLKAGGTGLNLTRATHVVHYDRWWNPAVEDQATDRAYRIGQDRPVQVHRLVTEGTLEDRIAQLLASKRELAEAVIGGGEAWISELSDADLADLVSLQAAS